MRRATVPGRSAEIGLRFRMTSPAASALWIKISYGFTRHSAAVGKAKPKWPNPNRTHHNKYSTDCDRPKVETTERVRNTMRHETSGSHGATDGRYRRGGFG